MPRLSYALASVGLFLAFCMSARASCAAIDSVAVASDVMRKGNASGVEPLPIDVRQEACLVSAGSLPLTALIVDVRNAAIRSRVPIMGATTLDLADLPGWDAPSIGVALVGTGLNQRELLQHCGQLRQRGVRAAVLDGGVQSLSSAYVPQDLALDAALIDAETVIDALRSEREAVLVTFDKGQVFAGGVATSKQPSAAEIRRLAHMPGPRILVGDRQVSERWWFALRGAGAKRVFIYSGSVEALTAASTHLDSVHQGRHWVAPTPCERQG